MLKRTECKSPRDGNRKDFIKDDVLGSVINLEFTTSNLKSIFYFKCLFKIQISSLKGGVL